MSSPKPLRPNNNNTRKVANRRQNKTVRNNILRKNAEALKLIQKIYNNLYNFKEINLHPNVKKRCGDCRDCIPYEPFLNGLHRSFYYIYHRWKRTPSPIENGPVHLTLTQLDKLRNIVLQVIQAAHEYFPNISDQERFIKISKALFDEEDINKFDNELKNYEEANPDKILRKGTKYAECAFPATSGLARLIPYLKYTNRQLKYIADYSDYQAIAPVAGMVIEHSLNFMNSNNPVAILTSTDDLKYYQENPTYDFKNFIVVKNEFFPPNIRPNSSEQPIIIFLRADRLLVTSFIIDAIQNRGIISIDKELAKLIGYRRGILNRLRH
jgi:hypothetical protein